MSARSTVSIPLEGAKRFILVLHDVTPEVRENCDQYLGELAAAGATRASLIVAPRAESGASATAEAPFPKWLAQLAQRGYDICLNGFEYIAVNTGSSSFFSWITGDPCDRHELFCIREDEALTKLNHGIQFFRNAGIEASAFHAPAWKMSGQARQAVFQAGIRCNLTAQHIEFIGQGSRIKAPALKTHPAWPHRPRMHRTGARLWHWVNRSSPILRISARAADIENEESRAMITDLVKEMARTRKASTCRELLDLYGAFSH